MLPRINSWLPSFSSCVTSDKLAVPLSSPVVALDKLKLTHQSFCPLLYSTSTRYKTIDTDGETAQKQHVRHSISVRNTIWNCTHAARTERITADTRGALQALRAHRQHRRRQQNRRRSNSEKGIAAVAHGTRGAGSNAKRRRRGGGNDRALAFNHEIACIETMGNSSNSHVVVEHTLQKCPATLSLSNPAASARPETLARTAVPPDEDTLDDQAAANVNNAEAPTAPRPSTLTTTRTVCAAPGLATPIGTLAFTTSVTTTRKLPRASRHCDDTRYMVKWRRKRPQRTTDVRTPTATRLGDALETITGRTHVRPAPNPCHSSATHFVLQCSATTQRCHHP